MHHPKDVLGLLGAQVLWITPEVLDTLSFHLNVKHVVVFDVTEMDECTVTVIEVHVHVIRVDRVPGKRGIAPIDLLIEWPAGGACAHSGTDVHLLGSLAILVEVMFRDNHPVHLIRIGVLQLRGSIPFVGSLHLFGIVRMHHQKLQHCMVC